MPLKGAVNPCFDFDGDKKEFRKHEVEKHEWTTASCPFLYVLVATGSV